MAGRTLLLAVALIVAAAATGSVAPAQLTVLSAPDYLRFDTSATTISVHDVPRVAANLLGLRTVQMPSWAAVSSVSPFKQPKAVVILGVDGCMQDVKVDKALPSFSLSHEEGASESLEAAIHFQSFAGAVVDATRDDTSVYAVSSSAVLAKQAMPTAASAARAVVWSSSRQAMVNGDGSVVIDAAATLRFISSGALGDTIRAEEQKVLVARPDTEPVAFDLANEAHLAFFAEMAAIFHTLKTADTDSAHPMALSFVLSALRPIFAAEGKDGETCKAAAHILSVFADKLTQLAEATFDGDVVVLMATVQTDVVTAPVRARREAATRNHRSIALGDNDFKPSQPAFVEHCAVYNYYCTSDTDGKPWDPDTRCSTSCEPSLTRSKTCSCISDTCAKSDPSVNLAMSTCRTCEDGYTLYGNHCYVYSDFPVAFNIILWLGVATLLATVAICYAIGGMDPGRNSIIYRMTAQRIKTQ